MAKEENGPSRLSYRFLAELAENEADRIEVGERAYAEFGWRETEAAKAIMRDQLQKAAGYRALGRMARLVSRGEFASFKRGGFEG